MSIDTLRADFPILARQVHGKALVYLDNAATTHKPYSVTDRIVAFYENENAGINRSLHALADEAGTAYEAAREAVRAYLNAHSSSEIVFTSGTTESINLIAATFGEAFVREGDEIVVTAMEHHANLVPWQRLCNKTGAVLRVVPIDESGVLRLDSLEELINGRTRLVTVTHVSNVTGIVNPVSEITAMAHARDVPVLIDGAQAIAHHAIDVAALDCDFYVFSGHKIYSAAGIGVLYGKHHWLDSLPPHHSGGGMVTSVSLEHSHFERAPLRFEPGTRNVAGAVSLEAALEYVMALGMEEITSHEGALLRRLEEGLREMKGTTVHGEADRRCCSLSFNLDAAHPADVGMVLDKLGIAVRTGTHCAQPYVDAIAGKATIRASVALYNTRKDIDKLLDGIERAAVILR